MDKRKQAAHANTIHQLRFVFRVGNTHAESIQRRCSAWFHATVKTRMTSLLQRLERESQGAFGCEQIDCLRIDIGDIPLDKFESELDARLWVQLERSIKNYRRERQLDTRADGKAYSATGQFVRTAHSADQSSLVGSGAGESDAYSHLSAGFQTERSAAAASSPGLGEANKEQTRSAHERGVSDPMASFVLFLHTGFLSEPDQWQAPSSPQAWLEKQLTKSPAAHWRALIARSCLQPHALRRLCETFAPSVLQALSRWLLAPSSDCPAPKRPNWGVYLPLSALLFLKRYPEHAHEIGPIANSFTTCLRILAKPIGPELEAWMSELLDPPMLSVVRAGLQVVCAAPPVRDALATELSAVTFEHLRAQILTLDLGFPDTLPARSNLTSSGELHGELSTATEYPLLQPHPSKRHPPVLDTRAPEPTEDKPLAVSNAGLVLLWPLLPRLFSTLELVDERGFVDAQARMQAVCYLDWLAWGEEVVAEWRVPLNRLVCAMPPEETLIWQAPDLARRAQLDAWLTSVVAQLPSLSRCSINDLRALFLQRPGVLRKVNTHKALSVEPEAADVLLNNVPWPLTQVMLPWLADPLPVAWL